MWQPSAAERRGTRAGGGKHWREQQSSLEEKTPPTLLSLLSLSLSAHHILLTLQQVTPPCCRKAPPLRCSHRKHKRGRSLWCSADRCSADRCSADRCSADAPSPKPLETKQVVTRSTAVSVHWLLDLKINWGKQLLVESVQQTGSMQHEARRSPCSDGKSEQRVTQRVELERVSREWAESEQREQTDFKSPPRGGKTSVTRWSPKSLLWAMKDEFSETSLNQEQNLSSAGSRRQKTGR